MTHIKLMKKTAITLLLVSSFLSFGSIANASNLTASEIKQKVIGKRVFLATRFGVEFPLVYKTNGSVTGDGTGTGLGRFFAPKETGNWWIKGNRLCQKFPTWYDGRTQCFQLTETGRNKLTWKTDDGRSGVASIR